MGVIVPLIWQLEAADFVASPPFAPAKGFEAEREGFEPSMTLTGHNGFRDRPDQPLWHLSERGEL